VGTGIALHHPAVLYPGKGPVPILQETRWAPGPIRTIGKSHIYNNI